MPIISPPLSLTLPVIDLTHLPASERPARGLERLTEETPVVLSFEDLQWADGGLLDFIEQLLDWSAEYPIFVVTFARPELMTVTRLELFGSAGVSAETNPRPAMMCTPSVSKSPAVVG